MAHPKLRHFVASGVFNVHSDLVEIRLGDAWQPAIYTDKGWATADGSSLLLDVVDWRDGQSTEQSGQSDGGVQARDTEQRQTRTRKRTSRQKPQAGTCHRPE
jgi:hypothetical protein